MLEGRASSFLPKSCSPKRLSPSEKLPPHTSPPPLPRAWPHVTTQAKGSLRKWLRPCRLNYPSSVTLSLAPDIVREHWDKGSIAAKSYTGRTTPTRITVVSMWPSSPALAFGSHKPRLPATPRSLSWPLRLNPTPESWVSGELHTSPSEQRSWLQWFE